MSGYVFVDTYLPILVTRRTAPASAATVSEMLQRVETYLEASAEKIAFVYDAGNVPGGMPDAAARSVTGNWFGARRRLLETKCLGIDFALESTFSRGALTAVFWIARPPVPWTLHDGTRAALASAAVRVNRSGAHDLAEMTRTVAHAGR